MADSKASIEQAIADFDSVELAVKECGVNIPFGTNTSEYGNKVREVYNKGIEVGLNSGHLKRSIVATLPTTDINEYTIYMVKADENSIDNKYIEWMYINDMWEKIGDTDVDLSEYQKTADLVAITNAEIDTIVST